MSNESLQPSIPPNNPVDPSIVRVLRTLDPVAREADCAYFVAGATARDLILVNIHGLRPGRATRDIDFGIAVENWDRFELLKERLVATGVFTSDRRALQRLTYSDQAAGFSMPVDLIPFRGVTTAGETIEWPPSRDIVMNVAGFEDALASSIPIQIEQNLTVRVASIPGLMILKLVAWSDRGRETDKDAADIYRFLTAYADAGNTDRLYEHEMDLLEAVGFDMQLAGAELLGRDVAALCSPSGLALIRSVLEAEATVERLVNHMVRTSDHRRGCVICPADADSFSPRSSEESVTKAGSR
ncbi:MAG: nucleotidyl transferase AbiEii/AbiGii toxin family protein [Acidobacteriota bacterium]|nr:nucleotidyl transferase AbiEii/AbiGii toxin family protein [Acidobacteriota bacterium]